MSEQVFNFATIGAVYADGVTLIFDGQTEASEKHYRCNTSVVFTAGDRVKILADSGTYVAEYVVGAPKQGGSIDAATLNGKTESELSVANAAKLGNKLASALSVASAVGVIDQMSTSSTILFEYKADGKFYIRTAAGAWKAITTT